MVWQQEGSQGGTKNLTSILKVVKNEMLLKIEDEIYLKRGQDRNFNIKRNRKVVWSIFERKKKDETKI